MPSELGLLVPYDEQLVERNLELIAPRSATLADFGRQMNRLLDKEWSDPKWRGIFKNHPHIRYRVKRLLAKELRAPAPRTLRLDGTFKVSYLSDIQIPFHDQDALQLAYKVVRWYDPDVVILGGDILDCTHLSDFDKSPARFVTLQEEAEMAQDYVLAPLRHWLPRARIIFLPGNHEDRIRRQMWRNPWLYEMTALRLENLLEMEKWGVEFAEHAVDFNGKARCSHGRITAAKAGDAAKRELELLAYTISTITGHNHRGAFVTIPKPGGDFVVGRENPCLCSLDPDWISQPRWTQGETHMDTKPGVSPSITPVDFSGYEAVVNGKWF